MDQAMNMLIELDHSCSTAKAIWLYFQVIHVLTTTESDKIITKLLDPATFYRLFFHWSWHVRMCFMYLFFF